MNEATNGSISIEVARVVACWHRTADEVKQGNWYLTAFELCTQWAAEFGLDVDCVIDTVAALSPQVKWTEQAAKTRQFIATVLAGGDYTQNYPGYNANKHKAAKIILYGDRSQLRGPKVQPFAQNIRDAGAGVASDTPVIDTWMIRLITGREPDDTDFSWGKQSYYQTIIRQAADLLGIGYRKLQEDAWDTIRKETPVRNGRTQQNGKRTRKMQTA